MITPSRCDLSLSRQCELVSISRSSFYYTPRGESAENLALMRRIDELFLRYPFYGSRQMVRQLRREGIAVGRHRVRRSIRRMGLEASKGGKRNDLWILPRPFRNKGRNTLEQKRIGLVAAAVSDHPEVVDLCSSLLERGRSLSFSSLRADTIY